MAAAMFSKHPLPPPSLNPRFKIFGAVDGFYLKVHTPPTEELRVEYFSGYKRWYGINFIFVMSPMGKVIYATWGYPGRVGDHRSSWNLVTQVG